jgi:tetratricopeptide (TPR) repeat protein
LEPSHNHHLRAAQGWLDLGNAVEAGSELAQIPPQFHNHPDVLEVRWRICAQTKQWDKCVQIAEVGIQLHPRRPDAWIHRSFALHELKRTQEALDQLRPAADRFSTIWTIPYNIACYCAQLGQLDACQVWLHRAMAIDHDLVMQIAGEDPDLKPLWDSRKPKRKRTQ